MAILLLWEYLQEGPQWWDIRVTRKAVQASEQNALTFGTNPKGKKKLR